MIRRRFLGALAWGIVACGGAKTDAPRGPKARVVSQVVLADEVLWELGPEVHGRVVGVSTMADDARYSTVAGQ